MPAVRVRVRVRSQDDGKASEQQEWERQAFYDVKAKNSNIEDRHFYHFIIKTD